MFNSWTVFFFFFNLSSIFSHEGNSFMQTPADNLAFLKDVAPPVASGRVLSPVMELPSMTALSCVYPISWGRGRGETDV